MIRLAPALGWGVLATALLTLAMSFAQGVGWSRVSLPYLLGTAFSGRRDRALAIGHALHLALGLAVALVYALAFEGWGRSGAGLGALLGLGHGLFVLGPGLELLTAFHPRMASQQHGPTPTRMLEPPGFLGLHYGRATPVTTLVAHVAFGALLGASYTPGG